MKKKHPHAQTLDRIGAGRIRSHFNLTPQGYVNWKARGVPRPHWRSIAVLGALHGVFVEPELFTYGQVKPEGEA